MNTHTPVQLTENALARVHQMKREKNNPTLKLRLYIVGGGCSGFQYGFALENKAEEDDILITQQYCEDPIQIMIDSLSLQYLTNATVDYIESLQGSRFVVNNPNAETTCGCGSSFTLKDEVDN